MDGFREEKRHRPESQQAGNNPRLIGRHPTEYRANEHHDRQAAEGFYVLVPDGPATIEREVIGDQGRRVRRGRARAANLNECEHEAFTPRLEFRHIRSS